MAKKFFKNTHITPRKVRPLNNKRKKHFKSIFLTPNMPSNELFIKRKNNLISKKGGVKKRKVFGNSKPYIINKHGVKLKEKDVKDLRSIRNEVNNKINRNLKDRINSRIKTQIKLFGVEQPMGKKAKEARTYNKDVEDFKTVKEFTRYMDRLLEINNNLSKRGAQGDELKRRILKALRNEGFTPPNGYAIRGDESGIADFIDEYLTGEEVDTMFADGFLTFEYIYGYENHFLKELILIDSMIKTTSKRDIYISSGSAQKFNDYLSDQFDMDDLTLEEYDVFNDWS